MSATEDEAAAIIADAQRHLGDLRRVRAVLWPDRYIPEVLAELSTIQAQVRACEAELAIHRADER